MKRISPFYYFCLPLPEARWPSATATGTGAVARAMPGGSTPGSIAAAACCTWSIIPSRRIRANRSSCTAGRAGGRAGPEALEVTGKSNSAWTILVLLVLGIGFLVVRLNLNLEAGDSDYRLTYTAEFHVRKPDGRAIVPDARLLAAFPETTRYCRVLEQEIDLRKWNWCELASTRRPRPQRHRAAGHQGRATQVYDLLSNRTRPQRRLAAECARSASDSQGAHDVPGQCQGHDGQQRRQPRKWSTGCATTIPEPQELVDRIFQECIEWIEPAGESGPDNGDEALLHQKGSPLGRARAFATLCRAAKIPARLVTGFEIKKPEGTQANSIRPRTWVEVYVADPQKPAVGRWVPYDPENGYLHELDYNIVPVRRDGVELVRVTNSTDLNCSITRSKAFRRRPAPSWGSSIFAAFRASCRSRSRWS